jgi:hypothetical protein
LILLLPVLSTLASCDGGGSNDPGPSSGLDRSTVVTDLSVEDAARFCDWMAARTGGYDQRIACGTTFVNAPPKRSSCAELFMEPVTSRTATTPPSTPSPARRSPRRAACSSPALPHCAERRAWRQTFDV